MMEVEKEVRLILGRDDFLKAYELLGGKNYEAETLTNRYYDDALFSLYFAGHTLRVRDNMSPSNIENCSISVELKVAQPAEGDINVNREYRCYISPQEYIFIARNPSLISNYVYLGDGVRSILKGGLQEVGESVTTRTTISSADVLSTKVVLDSVEFKARKQAIFRIIRSLYVIELEDVKEQDKVAFLSHLVKEGITFRVNTTMSKYQYLVSHYKHLKGRQG